MALVQRPSGSPHVELPPEYLNIRMHKDEKFKDFYWRVRTLEKNLGFQPDTSDHEATIELWLSRLTVNLFHKLRAESKGMLKFETVYHLFERCCSIECHDKIREARKAMVTRFNFVRVGNWALFEAEVDNREKLLGYFDIDDPEELSERRRIDSWLVRLTSADLELLRLFTNGLENIKTEKELLECLRQVEFGQRWEALMQNPPLSRYWWDIQIKDIAQKQEAATQPVDNKRKRKKSRGAEGDDEEQEQEATVPAVKQKSRRNRKSRHAQEEDEEEEDEPDSSPPPVEDKTRKRKKSRKIKEEVDEQVALTPIVEEKPRKRKKRVHFEDDEQMENQEDSPPTFKDKSRKRRKSRKAEDDEEEVVSPAVVKKSRKGKKSRKAKEEEEEEADDEQYSSTPVVKEKSRKRKKKSRQIEDEDQQLASPPGIKHKSRKRKRSHHVEADSDEAEAESSDVDEKPPKRKKIRSERREKRRG